MSRFGRSASLAAESPVADAAARGDREAVKSLLKQAADVNAAQGDGMTALHWAAMNGDVELAQMLIVPAPTSGRRRGSAAIRRSISPASRATAA